MKTIEVIVEYAGKNLSAYIEGPPIFTVGNNIQEVEHNMKEAVELADSLCISWREVLYQ